MVFSIIIYIIFFIDDDMKIYPIIIIINIIITLFHLLSLIIHIILIEFFLTKINICFEENKNSFIFDLFLAIINVIIFVNYFYFSQSCCKDNEDNKGRISRYNNI